MKYFQIVDWSKTGVRWVSYFDLLGFGNTVTNATWPEIINIYSQCLDEFTRTQGKEQQIEFAWFSDTFVLYARDDTQSSFMRIEQLSRLFMRGLLQKRIPVRGAISCGEFFADKPNQIFLGGALVDAHKFGERYNWIGFTLCPSAAQRMNKLGLQLPTLNYRNWDAEFKINQSFQNETVWAYPIGAESPQNGENIYLPFLREMAERNPDHIRKYKNTIHFLESHGVWMPVNAATCSN